MEKIPPVKELRKQLYHSENVTFDRRISIHFTRIALVLGARANHITFLRFVCLAAGLISIIKGVWFGLLGFALYLASVFLDSMDGAIARYNKEASFTGEVMDLTLDHASTTILYFISAGMISYSLTGDARLIHISVASIILAQLAAFLRALYFEFGVNAEQIKEKNSALAMFHQDNMRLLISALGIGIAASIWHPSSIVYLVHFYFAFVVIKNLYLLLHLWYHSKKFPLGIRILLAYFFGAIYLLIYASSKLAGGKASRTKKFLEKNFGDKKIIKHLLNLSA